MTPRQTMSAASDIGGHARLLNVRCAWHGPFRLILAYVGPAFPWSDGLCDGCYRKAKADRTWAGEAA